MIALILCYFTYPVPPVHAAGWPLNNYQYRKAHTLSWHPVGKHGAGFGAVASRTNLTPIPKTLADLCSVSYSGKIYIAGGYDAGAASSVSNRTYEYDPATDTWTQLADMPHAVWNAPCAIVDDVMYVFGGSITGTHTAWVQAYNITSNTWTMKNNFTSNLYPPDGETLYNGNAVSNGTHIFIIGGERDDATCGNVTIYDPATDTYTETGAVMPVPTVAFSAGLIGDLIVCAGGGPNTARIDEVQVYNITSNTWDAGYADLPVERGGMTKWHDVAWTGDDGKHYLILLFGEKNNNFYNEGLLWCLEDNETLLVANMTGTPRDGVGFAVIGNTVYVIGGRDGSGPLTDMDAFQITTLWSQPYEVKVTLHKGSGADSGSDVYLGSSVLDNFGDVRFTDASGNLLDYWFESVSSGSSAVAWVELNVSIRRNTTFYVYWGNLTPAAGISASNGTETFIFFDDFSGSSLSSAWAEAGSGSVSVSGGVVTVTSSTSSSSKCIHTTQLFGAGRSWPSDGRAVRVRTELGPNSAGWKTVGFAYKGGSWPVPYAKYRTDALRVTSSSGSFTRTSGDETNYQFYTYSTSVDNNWHVAEARRDGAHDQFTLDDGQQNRGAYPTSVSRALQINDDSAEGVRVDWILVRHWNYVEPSHGDWGATESKPYGPWITHPTDISYDEGETGNTITWQVNSSADTSGAYTVYRNGSTWTTGTWSNATNFQVNVDGCLPGPWNFTISAADSQGNATDTVIVRHMEERNPDRDRKLDQQHRVQP